MSKVAVYSEKQKACPKCSNENPTIWSYDFQICAICGPMPWLPPNPDRKEWSELGTEGERENTTFRNTDYTKSYVVRGFNKGDIILLQADLVRWSVEKLEAVHGHLKQMSRDTGIKFILMDKELKVVARLEAETPDLLKDLDQLELPDELSKQQLSTGQTEAGIGTGSSDRLADTGA